MSATAAPLLQRALHTALALAPVRYRIAWQIFTGRRDFQGADINRLMTDWITSIRSADEEIKKGFRTLRSRARELARNNGYVRHYLNILVSNVLGATGFTVQARVTDGDGKPVEPINKEIERGWKDWWEGPVTVDGRLTGPELESLLLETTATDGEAFVRVFTGFEDNPHGLALQPIDPDLVDETYVQGPVKGRNEIRMGVEVNQLGRPVAYWVWDRAQDDQSAVPRTRHRIPAEEIFHLYRPRRVNQTRGFTWFAPTMYGLHVLDGYEEAELWAARSAASKMGFFQSKDTALTAGAEIDTKTPIRSNVAPGAMEKLPVGWEFVPWSPDHPVGAFMAFIKTVLRKVAGGFGVAYNSLGNDLEGVNYSSLKNGLGGERDGARIIQRLWANTFRRRLHATWLQSALLVGAVKLPSRDYRLYTAVRFQPRGWPSIEPLKEMQAAVMAIKNGLGCRTDFLAEQGIEFDDVLERLKEEKEKAETAGVSILDVDPGELIEEKDEEPAAGPRSLVSAV